MEGITCFGLLFGDLTREILVLIFFGLVLALVKHSHSLLFLSVFCLFSEEHRSAVFILQVCCRDFFENITRERSFRHFNFHAAAARIENSGDNSSSTESTEATEFINHEEGQEDEASEGVEGPMTVVKSTLIGL